MFKCVTKILLCMIFFTNIFSNNAICLENPNNHSIYRDAKDPISVFNSNYSFISVTFKDVELMARVVSGESLSEPYEGKVAVAAVILNRVLNEKFPTTIEEVIKQQGAFSCVIAGEITCSPDRSCYSAVYDALKGSDPTNDALFFYNPKIATCPWMKSVSKNNVIQIGNHVFFISE